MLVHQEFCVNCVPKKTSKDLIKLHCRKKQTTDYKLIGIDRIELLTPIQKNMKGKNILLIKKDHGKIDRNLTSFFMPSRANRLSILAYIL